MYKTSRQRIIEYLEKRETVTASELAQAFRMTAANARHHLANMVEEGTVVIAAVHTMFQENQLSRSRRGRPEQRYQLRTNAQAHNLEKLAAALLSLMEENLESEILHRRLSSVMGGGTVEGKNMTARLQLVIRKLNGMNYRARWEARADAPRLVLGHCPYAGVLAQYPAMCRLDERMLSEMLGAQVSPAALLEEVRPGVRQCVFRVMA